MAVVFKRSFVILTFLLLLPLAVFVLRQKPQSQKPFDAPLTLEDWMDRTIDREFAAFQESGFSREMLEKTWKKGLAKYRNIQRFQVINSKVYGKEGFMKRLLQRIVEKYPLPDVDFLYHKGDRFNPSFFKYKEIKWGAPILVSAKHYTFDRAVLFCDYFYDIDDKNSGWNRMIQDVESNQERWPWESKEEKLFWRGSPTDGRYKLENWTSKPRGGPRLSNKFTS